MTQKTHEQQKRTDKDLSRSEQQRARRIKDAAQKELAKSNPKIDNNIIKGYN